MRKFFTLTLCVMVVLLSGCEQNGSTTGDPLTPASSSKIKTGDAIDITQISASMHGLINIDIVDYTSVACGIMLSESLADINSRSGKKLKANALFGNEFKVTTNDLCPGTDYYYCAYILLNNIQYEFGDIKTFTTHVAPALPTVNTSPVTNITTTSAVAGGEVINDGGGEVTARGICYSITRNPTILDNNVLIDSGIGAFVCNLSNLNRNTTYYVRAYATNSKGTAYGNQQVFKTLIDAIGNENGYTYVDLGLSVKWGTCNVGANRPEEYGDYFAWGETSRKYREYNWDTYKYCFEGWSQYLTKYLYDCANYHGTIDNKTTLDLSDDAAYRNRGGSWRMPTKTECEELEEQCTWTWTTQNGVKGYEVVSKINGESIFLPAGGYIINSEKVSYAGSYGYYWSSSLVEYYYPDVAHNIEFGTSYVYVSAGGCYRFIGMPVRPVCLP